MILTCPACGTKYTVKDGAIPPGGRQVRCANCKHSWHQDPEVGTGEASPPAPVAPVAPVESAAPVASEAPAAPAYSPPAGEPEAPVAPTRWEDEAPRHESEAPVAEDAYAAPPPEPTPAPVERGWDEPTPEPTEPEPQTITGNPEADERVREPEPLPYAVTHDPGLATPAMPAGEDGWAPAAAAVGAPGPVDMDFAVYESGREEFSGGKGKLLLGTVIALVVILAAVVAFHFLAPASFKQRLGLAAPSETLLKVQVDQRSRRTLASGQQVLEVTGKVINPSDQTQSVPPLQAQLRSLDQQVVYRWTIPAPAQTLPPGGSASFNSAELNIPASAACLDVWVDKQDLKACKADASGASAG